MVWWVVLQKIYKKTHLVSCTNTHRDVTYLVNCEIVKNIKTWISGKLFYRIKIFNLCPRWYLLRSYHFVEDFTFNLHASILSRRKTFWWSIAEHDSIVKNLLEQSVGDKSTLGKYFPKLSTCVKDNEGLFSLALILVVSPKIKKTMDFT